VAEPKDPALPGSPARKLAWLLEQIALGKLDADDSEEVAQAEALLLMLGRVSASRDSSKKNGISTICWTKGFATRSPRAIRWPSAASPVPSR
jgi:hypothetical protein